LEAEISGGRPVQISEARSQLEFANLDILHPTRREEPPSAKRRDHSRSTTRKYS
jgi:hypothetical protein